MTNFQPQLERVLLVAPHPDDGVLAAGGLLQRVGAAGGESRIVFLTCGETNAWPRRTAPKAWRTHEKQVGYLRCHEAGLALSEIGITNCSAFCLGYADQELAGRARQRDPALRDAIAAHIAGFAPTLILSPSIFDLHSDHSAAAWFTHGAAGEGEPVATYVVHGFGPVTRSLFTIQLTEEERTRKRRAIAAHGSQLLQSREHFISYSRPAEIFYAPEFDVMRLDTRAHAIASDDGKITLAVADLIHEVSAAAKVPVRENGHPGEREPVRRRGDAL